MNIIKTLADGLLDMIFPSRCAGCNEIIPKGESLCDYCFEHIETTAEDTRCKTCGCIKKDCQCRYHVFHFTAVTAPFYNAEIARRIMYAFKFDKKLEFVDFFARRMALSVRTDFYGVDFDLVAYVPMTLRRELKRGYNQSYELAVKLAGLLDIPLARNALGCKEKSKQQYKTQIKERFNNVKDVYYPNISLRGRKILLVDDIKTTGATLDECAKSLLKAGAGEVY